MLSLLSVVIFHLANAEPPYPYKVDIKLNDFNEVTINWRTDDGQKRVYFALECSLESGVSWLSFGFSDHGDYPGSDMCLWDGVNLNDALVDEHGSIRLRQKHYWRMDNTDRYPDGRMTLYFWRPYDTCEKAYYVIEDGTTQLAIAIGKTTRLNIYGEHVLKAIQPTRLIRTVPSPIVRTDSRLQLLEIVSKNVTIPAKETTYWCTVVKIPYLGEKRHIVKYEAMIQKGNEALVHHMEVFHCERPPTTGPIRFPMYNGECRVSAMPTLVKACKRVVGAWAMGAPPMVYPDEAGAPIGGPGYFPFVMLEVHYNNPAEKAGVVDSSGMRFYYTSDLRPNDAGVIEVGLEYTDRMAIPPGQPSFALTGYCTPECTDSLLPNDGITLFASQLHSHLTGRKLSTSLLREGVETAIVNRDGHYSPHWQEIRPVKPLQVFPGDSLVTTCVYDTTARSNITLGGFGISDEMCVNYIHYYPKSKLEVCKSATDTSALEDFFEFALRNEGQATSPQYAISENYKAIRWSKRLVYQLKTLFDLAPVKDECRRNDGELVQLKPRPPVVIQKLLPEKPRQCQWRNSR